MLHKNDNCIKSENNHIVFRSINFFTMCFHSISSYPISVHQRQSYGKHVSKRNNVRQRIEKLGCLFDGNTCATGHHRNISQFWGYTQGIHFYNGMNVWLAIDIIAAMNILCCCRSFILASCSYASATWQMEKSAEMNIWRPQDKAWQPWMKSKSTRLCWQNFHVVNKVNNRSEKMQFYWYSGYSITF